MQLLRACYWSTCHTPLISEEPCYKGWLHHIGVGCPYAGWRVILLVAGLDVRVLGIDGSPLRHLTLDTSVDYQRIP